MSKVYIKPVVDFVEMESADIVATSAYYFDEEPGSMQPNLLFQPMPTPGTSPFVPKSSNN